MKKNGIAKSLQIIGWFEVVGAAILNIFTDTEQLFGIDFGIAISVSAFISCMIFQGFAEIIDLLDKNGKKKDAIINLLQNRFSTESNAYKTVLQDIESNLPKM